MSHSLEYQGVRERIKGINIDLQTRCDHFNSDMDIIAIKFLCCGAFFSCFDCHEQLSDHAPQIWMRDSFDAKAILCGNCKLELSITSYMKSEFVCPNCDHNFNPKARYHYHLYFEM